MGTRIYTHTQEIEHCGECANVDGEETGDWGCRARLEFRGIKDVWGKIPKFCPLPEKKEK